MDRLKAKLAARWGLAGVVVCVAAVGGYGRLTKSSVSLFAHKKAEKSVADSTKALAGGSGPAVINGSNQLGMEMLAASAAQYNPGDICISPASVDLALTMLLNGGSGDTKAAISKTLGVDGQPLAAVNAAASDLNNVLTRGDPKVDLEIANSIWVQRGHAIQSDFLQRDLDFFGAKAANIDFSSSEDIQQVNDWVAAETKGKIPTILEGPQADAVILLLDAVYFKGQWAKPFDKNSTKPGDFHTISGDVISAPTMHQEGGFSYKKVNQAQVLSMSYGSGRMAMVVVLPDEAAGIYGLVHSLRPEVWSGWTSNLNEQLVNVSLPKFKMANSRNLIPTLGNAGMSIAFEPGKADFTGITGDRSLFISAVLHKTTIEVNEEGSVATAVTAVMGMTTSPGPDQKPPVPIQFVADHPFLYAIYDTSTNTILFLGVVSDPS